MAKPIFWSGFVQALPFILVIVPFSLVFGVVATEAGLGIAETMGFSVIVIAGAAQFTALQLMQDNAPTFIVLLSALAVNLRMAMYSASLTPYLGEAPIWKRALVAYMLVDQAYAQSVLEFEKRPKWTVSERLSFFFGVCAPIVPIWYLFTYVGALVGNTIPPEFALDFALPITFLAMIGPALRTPAHVAAMLTALVMSPALIWVPNSLGVLMAGLCAMIVGAAVEKRLSGKDAA